MKKIFLAVIVVCGLAESGYAGPEMSSSDTTNADKAAAGVKEVQAQAVKSNEVQSTAKTKVKVKSASEKSAAKNKSAKKQTVNQNMFYVDIGNMDTIDADVTAAEKDGREPAAARVGDYLLPIIYAEKDGVKSEYKLSSIVFNTGNLNFHVEGYINLRFLKDATNNNYLCQIAPSLAKAMGTTLPELYTRITKAAQNADTIFICHYGDNIDGDLVAKSIEIIDGKSKK